jgi:hypothetical protein
MKQFKRQLINKNRFHLTTKQRKALLLADAECDDPNNLVSHEEAVKEIEKWLNTTPKEKQKGSI